MLHSMQDTVVRNGIINIFFVKRDHNIELMEKACEKIKMMKNFINLCKMSKEYKLKDKTFLCPI